ncbi:hypothetical protein N7457_004352 [Penicillium paradoxum]|uniref:uncharacterized protein n=1 Tax=Penicillium paradoxum TaxID=176176 RepID=UPI0025469B3D|nr:uncharacterized protein N7457_004352 [Penicillium paradoxum]KAJ5782578.1 hypothetical protein N7457_004352 [Penicillium paradoxum]
MSTSVHRPQREALSPFIASSIRQPARRGLSISQHLTVPFPDVMDTNLHTKSLEFYGASSSVAFLQHVDDISGNNTSEQLPYSTPSILTGIGDGSNDRFYFRVGRRFLDAYFSNIHCIQPIFDQEEFLTRCEDLWFGKYERQPMTFFALYYATLSLGSLVMVWDEGEIYGGDRFSWSRKLFNQTLGIGKVCQHELNPHATYLYSGQATRTALATGLNRLPYGKPSDPRSPTVAAKTWWAVYCLDIQTSFALGRPDSLGPDEYHTQDIPGDSRPSDVEHSSNNLRVLQFVPCMVKLSRLMRKVGLRLYSLPCPPREELSRATELDAQLDYWFQQVPCHLKPQKATTQEPPLKRTGTASFFKKQSVVLMTRYLNLRMIIFGKSLTLTEVADEDMPAIRECQQKCIESASQAIDLVYDTFKNYEFFQTCNGITIRWYTSTYVLFAVSVLLTGIFHGIAQDNKRLDTLFKKVDRAIAILDVQNECVVTRNATIIIKRTLARAKRASRRELHAQQNSPTTGPENQQQDPTGNNLPSDYTGDLSHMGDAEIDWGSLELPMDDSQPALFWVEWGHLLNDLGA